MGVVAQFSYAVWAARYPEFAATVGKDLATAYFNEATIYWRNDGCGPAQTLSVQGTLLNMLTAHIAKMNAPAANGEPASDLVGRVSNASQGSESVQAENEYPPGTPQWFQQTKYGSAFWAATAGYRTAHYRPGPRRTFDWPLAPIGRGWWPF